MSTFSGYILATNVEQNLLPSHVECLTPAVPKGPTLTYVSHSFGIKRWDEYILQSPVALADEPEANKEVYRYQIFLVRGRDKSVLLASRRRIVDYLKSNILDHKIKPNCRRVNLPVEKIVDHCASITSEFLVTSLHGRVSGMTTDVKSISLYGDDLTSSFIYVDHHKRFNFHSAGFGRRLFAGLPKLRANEEGEIARLSYDGFTTTVLSSRQKAKEVVNLVAFVSKNGWIEDPLTHSGSM